MSVITIILIIYLIQLMVSCPIFSIIWYRDNIKNGKRKAILEACKGGLISFVPVIPIMAITYLIYIETGNEFKKWLKNDPTSPDNMNDPDFILPQKKIKKIILEPIKNRTDILDL